MRKREESNEKNWKVISGIIKRSNSHSFVKNKRIFISPFVKLKLITNIVLSKMNDWIACSRYQIDSKNVQNYKVSNKDVVLCCFP